MKTLALVIGNNNYLGNSKLENAVNDATSIAETFKRLNYDVIFKQDCNAYDCSMALMEFEEKIAHTDSSIFYFAGHGFQFDGENYLASIDCPVEMPNKIMCERTCITLSEILNIVKKSTTKVNILIIDACRRSFSRGVSNTFSVINAPQGTIIAFSTSPGEGAKDKGMEGHSVYTGVLLQYIGRELLSVEELFKKVRKTVHNLSGGSQTSWEHTSLIGDFYFNTGQMVHSISIPYDDSVVKDRTYVLKGDAIDNIIQDMKSCNWDKQNPAIDRFKALKPGSIDKNQQFIIGRNILQSGGYAFNAMNILENLQDNLERFNVNGENHVLNGILFEIYFNNNGDFRRDNFKKHSFEKVLAIRHNSNYKKSFEFIGNALVPFRHEMFYIPSIIDNMIDVDVFASVQKIINLIGIKEEYQIIESINVSSKDITLPVSRICQSGTNSLHLKEVLSNYFAAPIELIHLNENIVLKKLTFRLLIETQKEGVEIDF